MASASSSSGIGVSTPAPLAAIAAALALGFGLAFAFVVAEPADEGRLDNSLAAVNSGESLVNGSKTSPQDSFSFL